MNVALVHDYLVQDGGAERVLLALHDIYPKAPIFTLLYDQTQVPAAFQKLDVRPSRLNNLPFRQHYKWYLPLMAHAIESFDLSGYDLIISNSSSFAKGAIAPAQAIHICYCHSPTRFLWHDRRDYVRQLNQPQMVKPFVRLFLHGLRQWDRLAAERPDVIVTNSQTSRSRIQRYYGRDATVIYPPVDMAEISPTMTAGRFWLAGGRLVGSKRFDLVVQAFNKLNLPLKIFGTGPEEKTLRALAGPNIQLLGKVDETSKRQLYQQAIGFLYPQVEDFGLTAIEAMAAGKPVVAYDQGGATETIVPGVTGQFFGIQCWQDIANAIIRFKPERYRPERIRNHAERFSQANFRETWKNLVTDIVNKRKNHQADSTAPGSTAPGSTTPGSTTPNPSSQRRGFDG